MDACIEKKASGEGYVALAAGLSPFYISVNLFIKEHLYLGQVLSEAELSALKEKQALLDCTDQALVYLARREHSSKELSVKLRQKGYQGDTIEMVLGELKEKNYLSDLRYAVAFIESRQRKSPEGKILMQQRLQGKGVDRQTIQAALEECFTEALTIEYVHKAYELVLRKGGEEKARPMLQKKGFTSYDIRLAFDD